MAIYFKEYLCLLEAIGNETNDVESAKISPVSDYDIERDAMEGVLIWKQFMNHNKAGTAGAAANGRFHYYSFFKKEFTANPDLWINTLADWEYLLPNCPIFKWFTYNGLLQPQLENWEKNYVPLNEPIIVAMPYWATGWSEGTANGWTDDDFMDRQYYEIIGLTTETVKSLINLLQAEATGEYA